LVKQRSETFYHILKVGSPDGYRDCGARKFKIDKDFSPQIKNDFSLAKMVEEHIQIQL